MAVTHRLRALTRASLSAAAVILPCLAIAACGSSGADRTTATGKLTAQQVSSVAKQSKAPPVSDIELATGTPAHQITETLVSFYRAAWQNDAARACSLFSPAGAAGFEHASKSAFPGSVLPSSPCTHDMQLFSAALGDSVSNLQQDQPNVSGDILNNVGVAEIKVRGNAATALAPMNVEEIINPKRISLVRVAGRWRIAGSQSLNKSNLPQILKRAERGGQLGHKK
jgi:hypothetical protein